MSAQISSISSCCSSAADGEFFKDIPFVPISPSPLPFSISEKGSARSETPPPQGLSVNR